MGDMAAVAERLRLVRAARRKFLRMWAIDQAMLTPLLDRLAADLAPEQDSASPGAVHCDLPEADKG